MILILSDYKKSIVIFTISENAVCEGVVFTRMDSYYTRPKEAERKLNMAWKLGTPVYLFGVTGIGKTSLIIDFLGSRKYVIYSLKKISPEQIVIPEDEKNHIVVIDDLHCAEDPEERKQYKKVIEALLEKKNVWLILISRANVPGWIMPLYIQYSFVIIGQEELCFSREEQIHYLEDRNIFFSDEMEKRYGKRQKVFRL